MTHAVRFDQTGGPEVLTWEALEVGAPAAGEAHRSTGASRLLP